MPQTTSTQHGGTIRVPAEWEPYGTVMIAWPHADTDWASMLPQVTECYVHLAEAIVNES